MNVANVENALGEQKATSPPVASRTGAFRAAVTQAIDWSAKTAIGCDLFISYATGDRAAYARGLYEQLSAGDAASPGTKPLLVFYAREPEEPLVGQPLKPALARAVRRSRAVVLLDSKAARESRYVALEVATAMKKRNRLVIPVVSQGTHRTVLGLWDKALDQKIADELDHITGVSDSPEALTSGTPSPSALRSIRVALAGRRKRRTFLQLCMVLLVALAALGLYAEWLSHLRNLDNLAETAAAELDGSEKSLAEVTRDAAAAIRWYHHTPDADATFRRASMVTLRRRSMASGIGAVRLASSRDVAARLSTTGVERHEGDPFAETDWQPVLTGKFNELVMDEEGRVIVAADAAHAMVWHDNIKETCYSAAEGQAIQRIAVDPLGRRMAVLSEVGNAPSAEWRVAVKDIAHCGDADFVLPSRRIDATVHARPDALPRITLNRGGDVLAAAFPFGWALWRVRAGVDPIRLEADVGRTLMADVPQGAGPADNMVVTAESFSPDGQQVAIGAALSNGGSNVTTGPQACVFSGLVNAPDGMQSRVLRERQATAVAFASDGQTLATDGQDLQVWDLSRSEDTPLATAQVASASVLTFAKQDRLLVAVTSQPAQVHVIDSRTGAVVSEIESPFSQAPVLTSGGNQRALVVAEARDWPPGSWPVYEGREVASLQRVEWSPDIQVSSGAINQHGAFVLGSSDGYVKQKNAPGQPGIVPEGDSSQAFPLQNASRGPTHLSITESGLAIGRILDEHGAIVAVRCRSGQCQKVEGFDDQAMTAVAADPITGALVKGCADGSIVEGSSPCGSTAPWGLAKSVSALAVSKNAIVKAQRNGRVCIARRSQPTNCRPLPPASEDLTVQAVDVSADGFEIAVALKTGTGPMYLDVLACGPFERQIEFFIGSSHCTFERRSRIVTADQIYGVRFTDDGDWLNVVSVSNDRAVVAQKLPIAARSIVLNSQATIRSQETKP